MPNLLCISLLLVIFIYIGNNMFYYYMYLCYLGSLQINNVYCEPPFFIGI